MLAYLHFGRDDTSVRPGIEADWRLCRTEGIQSGHAGKEDHLLVLLSKAGTHGIQELTSGPRPFRETFPVNTSFPAFSFATQSFVVSAIVFYSNAGLSIIACTPGSISCYSQDVTIDLFSGSPGMPRESFYVDPCIMKLAFTT